MIKINVNDRWIIMMALPAFDQHHIKKTIQLGDKTYHYYSLEDCYKFLGDLSLLPFSMKILLENLLRRYDGKSVTIHDLMAFSNWLRDKRSDHEIAFQPARVLMQDFTGVPAIVDLAAMRTAMKKLNDDPQKINPLANVDLVIDHSVMVDDYGQSKAFGINVDLEYQRNRERYNFLRWGQTAFNNFRVVPPGTGICHQVNLEYLGKVVWTQTINDQTIAYPDTLVGTDSHTTMINGLGILGWGVGGIEAEAAMLGQPISMLLPEVVGFKLSGQLPEGATATDLVLTITHMLRQHGVVGKFVEFYGPGLDYLSLADRATISNMSPEFGATCAIFPIDQETINYLKFTGREAHQVELVQAYAQAQGLWRTAASPEPVFTTTLTLDLSSVESTMAGPKRPQDKVLLSNASETMHKILHDDNLACDSQYDLSEFDHSYTIKNGDVVIAAITSCTNTSNPAVMLGAGLIAKKAIEKGLTVKPWVKTSLAPGSQVVTDYLNKAGLQDYLDQLGFNLVGYGCTTCIGNSGPLDPYVSAVIDTHKLGVCAVLSGNRNFEGRIHAQVKYSYLASPMLVVIYSLTGSMLTNVKTDVIGTDQQGQPVYLKDLWPSNADIQQAIQHSLTPQMYIERYAHVFEGDQFWQELSSNNDVTYNWDDNSTYIKHPPYFEHLSLDHQHVQDIDNACILAMFGDSITTDHISPAGNIKENSPAGAYLKSQGASLQDFNSYGSRRGNHDVMIRGTFANIRLVNEMANGTVGGFSRLQSETEIQPLYDVAMHYQVKNTPLVIIAGREYGSGSSRDWAAKGTRLLGVKAVIAESFERIHRSNLIGMGVLPLQFLEGESRHSHGLTGDEHISIKGLSDLKPKQTIVVEVTTLEGEKKLINVTVRIDTIDELEYYNNNGILHYVLRRLMRNDFAS